MQWSSQPGEVLQEIRAIWPCTQFPRVFLKVVLINQSLKLTQNSCSGLSTVKSHIHTLCACCHKNIVAQIQMLTTYHHATYLLASTRSYFTHTHNHAALCWVASGAVSQLLHCTLHLLNLSMSFQPGQIHCSKRRKIHFLVVGENLIW